ncbi:MAG: ABC transporter substrate-binding protein [Pseudomonadota bacterium]
MRTAVLLSALLALPAQAQETRVFTDHLDRQVTVPANPTRIVSLGSKNVTVPLIELGAVPVGSQGTQRTDGSRVIRASGVTTGVDFDNSEIAFVGDFPVDLELVAALEPDLIIWPDWQDGVALEQVEAIAPTVAYVTDTALHEAQEFYARLLGRGDLLAANRARYDAQLAQLKGLAADGTTVSYLQAFDGTIYSCNPYGHIGLVLGEAGFDFPPIIDTIAPGDCDGFSAESLQDFDADWIFVTYRTDRGQTPADAVAALEEVLPSYCTALTACQAGRLVFMPREEVTTPSYDAAMAVMFALATHMSDPARQVD